MLIAKSMPTYSANDKSPLAGAWGYMANRCMIIVMQHITIKSDPNICPIYSRYSFMGSFQSSTAR